MAVGIFLDSQLSNSRVQYAASFPNMMIFMVTFPFTWYNILRILYQRQFAFDCKENNRQSELCASPER